MSGKPTGMATPNHRVIWSRFFLFFSFPFLCKVDTRTGGVGLGSGADLPFPRVFVFFVCQYLLLFLSVLTLACSQRGML